MGLRRWAEARACCEAALAPARASSRPSRRAQRSGSCSASSASPRRARSRSPARWSPPRALGAGEDAVRAHLMLGELRRLRGDHAGALAVMERGDGGRRAAGHARLVRQLHACQRGRRSAATRSLGRGRRAPGRGAAHGPGSDGRGAPAHDLRASARVARASPERPVPTWSARSSWPATGCRTSSSRHCVAPGRRSASPRASPRRLGSTSSRRWPRSATRAIRSTPRSCTHSASAPRRTSLSGRAGCAVGTTSRPRSGARAAWSPISRRTLAPWRGDGAPPDALANGALARAELSRAEAAPDPDAWQRAAERWESLARAVPGCLCALPRGGGAARHRR